MSKTLFESLLKDFTKANSARKLKLAVKAGFATAEEYRDHLNNLVSGGTNEVVKPEPKVKASKTPITVKPTIHVVDIIDCSGSMSGDKIKNAIKGINNGIEKLKADTDVKYTYTICDFACRNDIKYSKTLCDIKNVSGVTFRDRGMTALRDAVGKTLNLVNDKVSDKNEKVLVNIYTDGGENDSTKYSDSDIKELIAKLQKENFTITFIGTDRDVTNVIRAYDLHESNTLKYDGSAKGLEATLASTSIARSSFKSKVLKGEDVTMGFYKDIN